MAEIEVDKNLARMCNILEEYKLIYWIDSGTLLGLIRNGKVFDNDLDVSIVYEKDKAKRLIKRLNMEGFRVRVRQTYDSPESLEIKSFGKDKSSLDFDLKFFKKFGNYYLSPTVFSLNAFRKKFSRSVYDLIKLPFSVFLRIVPNSESYTRWFNRTFYCAATWVVPSRYIGKTKKLTGTNLSTPEKTEEYLEYRYGPDWKIPNSNWDYVKDDKGFVLREINDFLKAKQVIK